MYIRTLLRRVGAMFILSVMALAGCSSAGEEDVATDRAGAQPADLIADCLRELGWDVTTHPDNSMSTGGIPDDQRDRFDSDHKQCIQEGGFDQPRPPITEQQASEYFDALLEAGDCVSDLGYLVDDPPSRQAAIEALQQERIDVGWDPYEQVILTEPSKLEDVYRECPPPRLPS